MYTPFGYAPSPSFAETQKQKQDDSNKQKILISLTLLVDKHLNKVLGAEAGKDFVDLLFGLLHLPLGSIIELLQKHGMQISVGSIGRVFGSVEKMDLRFFHSQEVKESLMRPQVAVYHPLLPQNNFSPLKHQSQGGLNFNLGGFGSTSSASSSIFGSSPPVLFCTPTTPAFSMSQVAATSSLAGKEVMGFVKEDNTKFMVEDNLRVTPISLESLFNAIVARDSSSLERRIVKISFKKSLEILKASFESDTVLTDVFIEKNLSSKEDPVII